MRKEVSILRVDPDKTKGGLKKESAVKIDQIRTIDNIRLIKKIGDLPKGLEDTVKENLKIVMDL